MIKYEVTLVNNYWVWIVSWRLRHIGISATSHDFFSFWRGGEGKVGERRGTFLPYYALSFFPVCALSAAYYTLVLEGVQGTVAKSYSKHFSHSSK